MRLTAAFESAGCWLLPVGSLHIVTEEFGQILFDSLGGVSSEISLLLFSRSFTSRSVVQRYISLTRRIYFNSEGRSLAFIVGRIDKRDLKLELRLIV